MCLLLSLLIPGTSGEPESTLNAMAVGIGLLTLSIWVLRTGGSRATEVIRLSLGGWLVLAPFVLGFESAVASRSAWVAGVLLVATTDVARLLSTMDRMLRARSRTYRALRLSPERIVHCESPKQTLTPETLSQHIVERSEQIHETLLENASTVEVEMCILGYKGCTADMLLLLGRIEEELPGANFIRRWSLETARRKAIKSLTRIREALPPATVRTLPPGKSGEG